MLLIFGPLPGLILLEEIVQRSGNVSEAWNPSVIKVYKTNELVHPLNRGGTFPITHISNLLVFHFESVTANVDTKELHLFPMELAFLQVAIESSIFEALKHRQDSFYMFQFSFVMHKDIVKVNLNTLVQEWCEHFVHVSLKTGRSVCKPKSHDLHSIQSERCHKRSFPFVAGSDSDLIISRFQIELSEVFRDRKSVV